ncbi:hypothetical protein Tcan_02232 [Toxocara canis]|uniref:Uncharacterized protein n=1 Tax=Toxocara canis TaxID=6265 RepID=A0A0B2URB8_TOXCA|nr:hypothetical protein Tcan_02232 [Toxocara canis]
MPDWAPSKVKEICARAWNDQMYARPTLDEIANELLVETGRRKPDALPKLVNFTSEDYSTSSAPSRLYRRSSRSRPSWKGHKRSSRVSIPRCALPQDVVFASLGITTAKNCEKSRTFVLPFSRVRTANSISCTNPLSPLSETRRFLPTPFFKERVTAYLFGTCASFAPAMSTPDCRRWIRSSTAC